MNYFERHPLISLLVVGIVCVVALNATEQTATIETIDGVEYITAIDGEDLYTPRRPTKYDLELKWERK